MKVTLTYRDLAGNVVTEVTTLVTFDTVFVAGTDIPVELPDDQDIVYFEDENGLFFLERENIIDMKTDLFPPSLN